MRKSLLNAINGASETELREALLLLVEEHLEDLEQDDFFGTEGLLHYLGWDD